MTDLEAYIILAKAALQRAATSTTNEECAKHLADAAMWYNAAEQAKLDAVQGAFTGV